MITNYSEFLNKLYEAGFSVGGENDEGVFSLSSYFADNIHWHTDDADTDPWEWRMKVLEDREDAAYAKVFFKKSGYITKEWYPYFLAVRRPYDFYDEYASGTISADAKRIYEVIESMGEVPLHTLKTECGVDKSTKSKFEKALVELQMRMYVTMCGRAQKISAEGKPYGWFSTVFCLAENYFDDEVFDKARNIDKDDAIAKITQRIYELNPNANEKKIAKFING